MLDLFKEIKYFWQRGKRGYSDRDTWDVNSYLSKVIPPMLRKLKEGDSCPITFYDKGKVNDECKRWHECLEEIAQGFEAINNLDKLYYSWKKGKDGHYKKEYDPKSIDIQVAKMNKGLQLFAKYFVTLWD